MLVRTAMYLKNLVYIYTSPNASVNYGSGYT